MHASLIGLHGFLGSPKDFLPLKLPRLYAPYIFNTVPRDLKRWAQAINRTVPEQNIILGYSMGGRLALHCLLEHEAHYRAAIILAAHPGLSSAHERYERYEADKQWAEKIKTLPWEMLNNAWHQSPLFAGSPGPPRLAQDFDRSSLALAMKRFSLGTQGYLVPAINTLRLPLLWLYAAQEEANVAKIKLKNPLSQMIAMPGGHRFMFTEKEQVSSLINSFINKQGVAICK